MADPKDEKAGAPSAMQLMPFDEAFRKDPHPRLKQLRETCPVHREPDFDRVQVSSFEQVRNMLYDLSLGVDPRKSLPDDPIRQFQREDGGEVVDAKSIMELLLLEAGPGTELTLVANGPQASEAAEAIRDLFEREFDGSL